MREYNPSTDHQVLHLGALESPADVPEALLEAQRENSRRVMAALGNAHFSEIVDEDISGADVPHHPQYTAVRHGRPCCICMPEIAEDMMHIRALSPEQCDCCETLYPDHDVYYASLIDIEGELYLFMPYMVRTEGSWLIDEVGAEQFLPLAMREGNTRYSAIFGDAALFKLCNLIMPFIADQGEKRPIRIPGLHGGDELQDEPYYLISYERMPNLALLAERTEKGQIHLHRLFFSYEQETHTELELLSVISEDPRDGVVELLDSTGRILYAECAEAAVVPHLLPLGRRYMWSLSMVAADVQSVEKELTFTSGAFYEFEREAYRREKGEEPPEDFVASVSMESFRACLQDEHDSYATLVGQVVDVRQAHICGRCVTAVNMRFSPDHDSECVCVFMDEDVAARYEPVVGETLSVSGLLYARPSELVADTESWQQALEDMDEMADMSAHEAFYELGKASMSLGVAAAAFISAGWKIIPPVAPTFARTGIPLTFIDDEGKSAFVMIDTIINGHEPEYSFAEAREKAESILREDPAGGEAKVYLCTVRLDYHEKMERYAVSMSVYPECPPVTNRLLYAATPRQMSEGDIAAEDVLAMERAAAAELRDAFRSDSWLKLAELLHEEMEYTAAAANVQLVGKMDFLCRMCELAQNFLSEDSRDTYRFCTGCVVLDEVSRPCMVIYREKVPLAVVVFDVEQGLVRHVQALPGELISSFVPDPE